MKYKDGSAFRRALEDRLRNRSLTTGEPLMRLRKMVAFDRMLARLIVASPELWVLKGGYALQLRIGARARTTKDVDLLLQQSSDKAHSALIDAASTDLKDWFSFEVGQAIHTDLGDQPGSFRYPVHSLLDRRTFERFRVDVGTGDPMLVAPENLTGPPLLEFAGITPTTFPSYPVPQHLAEKIHAYTREYGTRENTRVKDLIDILLIAMTSELESSDLTRAVSLVFKARATHKVPDQLPDPPPAWSRSFPRLRRELELPWGDLKDAMIAARQFLDPALKEDQMEMAVRQISGNEFVEYLPEKIRAIASVRA